MSGSESCSYEWILKFDDVARGTDHDLAFERQLPCDRRAQCRLADVFANNERADSTDVHDAEPGQLLRDERRLASVCPTDVHRTKKYDRRHGEVSFAGQRKR